MDVTGFTTRHVANPLLGAILRGPLHRIADGALLELRFRGATTKMPIRLVVTYAETADRLVVFPGHPERKRWWRSFRAEHPVTVVHRGRSTESTAVVVSPADAGWETLADAYRARWPRAPEPELLVAIDRRRADLASRPPAPRARRAPR